MSCPITPRPQSAYSALVVADSRRSKIPLPPQFLHRRGPLWIFLVKLPPPRILQYVAHRIGVFLPSSQDPFEVIALPNSMRWFDARPSRVEGHRRFEAADESGKRTRNRSLKHLGMLFIGTRSGLEHHDAMQMIRHHHVSRHLCMREVPRNGGPTLGHNPAQSTQFYVVVADDSEQTASLVSPNREEIDAFSRMLETTQAYRAPGTK